MATPNELEAHRADIDRIDDQIVDLLIRRFKTTQEVGQIKADQGTEIRQDARFGEMLIRLRERAEEGGLNPEVIDSVWTEIHEQSIAQQSAIIESK